MMAAYLVKKMAARMVESMDSTTALETVASRAALKVATMVDERVLLRAARLAVHSAVLRVDSKAFETVVKRVA